MWALPRCLRALRHGVNLLNPLHAWPNRATYEFRLVKYAARGFAISVPALDLQRCDLLVVNSTPLKELKGLARLLKLVLCTGSDRVPVNGLGGCTYRDEGGPLVSACDPLKCNLLRAGDFLGEEDVFAKAMTSAYSLGGVIIPSIFFVPEGEEIPPEVAPCTVTAMALETLSGLWQGGLLFAADTRDRAWAQIEDAGDGWTGDALCDRISRRLDNAWDTSKRSREYLNATEGDIVSRYYAHAHTRAAV